MEIPNTKVPPQIPPLRLSATQLTLEQFLENDVTYDAAQIDQILLASFKHMAHAVARIACWEHESNLKETNIINKDNQGEKQTSVTQLWYKQMLKMFLDLTNAKKKMDS